MFENLKILRRLSKLSSKPGGFAVIIMAIIFTVLLFCGGSSIFCLGPVLFSQLNPDYVSDEEQIQRQLEQVENDEFTRQAQDEETEIEGQTDLLKKGFDKQEESLESPKENKDLKPEPKKYKKVEVIDSTPIPKTNKPKTTNIIKRKGVIFFLRKLL